jgi:Cu(I)/Ag(I) efflux system membrane fusion protein/cobalt-zinc-cadmium efflux system membrane fusion protein
MTPRLAKIIVAVLVAAILVGVLYRFRHRVFPVRGAASDQTMAPMSTPSAQTEIPRAPVEIDTRRQQLIGVRTVAATRAPLSQTVRTLGVVAYDETRQVDVNVKFDGWIRDLLVNFTGQPVSKGQPLFTLYSPQLLAAESEYLLALKSRDLMQQSEIADARERAGQLVAAARQRLSLWDVPDEELALLERDRAARSTITVRSPAGGFIAAKPVIQGMHVVAGQTLFKISDVSTVWIEADVYESEMPLIRVGQSATVTLDAFPDDRYTGRVVYVYPYVDERTRTNKVRYAFSNSNGRLKPGMFANVVLNVGSGDGIVIPANAVLDSGREQIVFVVQDGGRFEPRPVKVSRRMGDSIQVLEGIREGERVAESATFFIDSESQLRGSLQGYGATPTSPAGPASSSRQLDISFRSIPDPPRVGENQFEVLVKDDSGKPVEGAEVEIQFFMAAMPTMNMPAMRNVVKLAAAGSGTYRGTGQILLGGRWDATIAVTRTGQQIGSRRTTVVTP